MVFFSSDRWKHVIQLQRQVRLGKLRESSPSVLNYSEYSMRTWVIVRGCDKKFPDWVDNEITTLVEKQHKELWRQNSLDWLTKQRYNFT
jgi:hypothetical protein